MVGGIENTRGQHEVEKIMAICQQKQKLLCAKFLNFILHLFMRDLNGGAFVVCFFCVAQQKIKCIVGQESVEKKRCKNKESVKIFSKLLPGKFIWIFNNPDPPAGKKPSGGCCKEVFFIQSVV